MQSLALLIFGSQQQKVASVIEIPSIYLGSIELTGESIVTLGVTVVVMVALALFIKKTKTGRAMLALSEDKGAAELMGINVNRTISMTFAIGSALAAVAGVLFVSSYGFVGPYTGSLPGIKAFVAAVLGGIGSIPGAMLGGYFARHHRELLQGLYQHAVGGCHRVWRAHPGADRAPCGAARPQEN